MEAQGLVATGVGTSWAASLAALGLVTFLAWGALRRVGRGGGSPAASADLLRVRTRLVLEPKRSLFIVEVGSRAFLVGASEGGLGVLAELGPGELPEAIPESPRWGRLVERLLRGR